METMIQVNELTKVFKTDEVETWALDKVNIEIGQGEFVAVMGPWAAAVLRKAAAGNGPRGG